MGAGQVPDAAWAQEYPARPLRMVAGFAPGGITDVLARAVAARMSEGLGQTVNVENRPGAGTLIACERVARAPADGYTHLGTEIARLGEVVRASGAQAR